MNIHVVFHELESEMNECSDENFIIIPVRTNAISTVLYNQ